MPAMMRLRRRDNGSMFRTMGMRHVVVVDGELKVVGIITRTEMNEHHLAHYWKEEVCFVHNETGFPPRLAHSYLPLCR